MSDFRQGKAVDGETGSSPEQEILRAIASIDYGSVEVTIHDGRIVQIECREKIRLGGPEAPRKSPIRQIR
ncbi:MAG TPA: YezD family protein [Burkholderiales bacterium]